MNCGPEWLGWLQRFIPQWGMNCTLHDMTGVNVADLPLLGYKEIQEARLRADTALRDSLLIQGRESNQADWRVRFRAWRWFKWMRIFGRLGI